MFFVNTLICNATEKIYSTKSPMPNVFLKKIQTVLVFVFEMTRKHEYEVDITQFALVTLSRLENNQTNSRIKLSRMSLLF